MAARLVRKNGLLALGSGVVTPIKPFTRLPLFLTLLSLVEFIDKTSFHPAKEEKEYERPKGPKHTYESRKLAPG